MRTWPREIYRFPNRASKLYAAGHGGHLRKRMGFSSPESHMLRKRQYDTYTNIEILIQMPPEGTSENGKLFRISESCKRTNGVSSCCSCENLSTLAHSKKYILRLTLS